MNPVDRRISLIWAMSENRVIGSANQLPWHLPADLQYFKRITSGHPVVLGRKNYQSIGKPLPNRSNIVLTRARDFDAPGCMVAHSTDEALSLTEPGAEIFIIGGAKIYREFLPLAQKLYITEIHANIDGDITFPGYSDEDWREISRECHDVDDRNPYPYSFVVCQRVANRND
jgi:dihydrofolate reductase